MELDQRHWIFGSADRQVPLVLGDGVKIYNAFDANLVAHIPMRHGMAEHFTELAAVENFADASAGDATRFNRWFHGMLSGGVYLAASSFEAGFVSSAHGDGEIAKTLEAAERVVGTL